MNAAKLDVNVRVLVGGKAMPAPWRLRLFGLVAALLRVPIELRADMPTAWR